MKIAAFWEMIRETSGVGTSNFDAGVALILKVEGGYSVEDMSPWDFVDTDNSDKALDILGALLTYVSMTRGLLRHLDPLARTINNVFEDYRVAFRAVNAEIVPIGSDELHTEVVAPALRLLIGDKYAKAHSAYLEAVKEIPASPANAITDAGTALQEVLTSLGCEGNALGPLIKSARKRGLLASHDETLGAGVEKLPVLGLRR